MSSTTFTSPQQIEGLPPHQTLHAAPVPAPPRVYLQGSASHLIAVVIGGYPEIQRHDALVVLAREGTTLTLRSGDFGAEYGAAALAPLARHSLESGGGFALVSVHMWHPLYKALRAVSREPITRLPREAFSHLAKRLDMAIDGGGVGVGDASELVDDILAVVVRDAPPVASLDPRVLEAMKLMDQDLATPVETLAQQVGTSKTKLLHLFVSELGLSHRGFATWLRMRIAWELIVLEPKTNLSDIAERVGFSSAGHLSRAFHECFGITPSKMRDWRGEVIGHPLPGGRRAFG